MKLWRGMSKFPMDKNGLGKHFFLLKSRKKKKKLKPRQGDGVIVVGAVVAVSLNQLVLLIPQQVLLLACHLVLLLACHLVLFYTKHQDIPNI